MAPNKEFDYMIVEFLIKCKIAVLFDIYVMTFSTLLQISTVEI